MSVPVAPRLALPLPDTGWLGRQEPRFWTAPPRHRHPDPECRACADPAYASGCGDYQSADLLEWGAAYGYDLDPWQRWWLTEACGTSPDGTWAAFEVMLIAPRQNGKNGALEVRELGGLYILGERTLIHTAHEFKASQEHFRRVRDTITAYDDLRRRVKSVTTSHGDEAIELRPRPTLIFGPGGTRIRRNIGARLRFLARSRGSGRSFTADFVAYDEAMILSADVVSASLPTLSAVANPQVAYTASAGYQDSVQLASVRRRVIRKDPTLMGAEWSVTPHADTCPRDEVNGRKSNRYITCSRHDDRDDPRSWAKANPALGIRISVAHVAREMEALAGAMAAFDRERLGIGDWPSEDAPWVVISEEAWDACAMDDPGGATRPVAFAFDVDPDMISATIAACWERPPDQAQRAAEDNEMIAAMKASIATGMPLTPPRYPGGRAPGRPVVEIPRGCSREGTAWVIPRLAELRRKWRPAVIAAPKNGPAAGLGDDAANAGLDITWASSADEAAAFALFVARARARDESGTPVPRLIHLGREQAPGLRASVASAETRVVGDGGRAWCRRDSESDITPVTSGTLALWALNKRRRNYDPLKSVAAPGRPMTMDDWMRGTLPAAAVRCASRWRAARPHGRRSRWRR